MQFLSINEKDNQDLLHPSLQGELIWEGHHNHARLKTDALCYSARHAEPNGFTLIGGSTEIQANIYTRQNTVFSYFIYVKSIVLFDDFVSFLDE